MKLTPNQEEILKRLSSVNFAYGLNVNAMKKLVQNHLVSEGCDERGRFYSINQNGKDYLKKAVEAVNKMNGSGVAPARH